MKHTLNDMLHKMTTPEIIAEIERLSYDGVTRDNRPDYISKDVWTRYAVEPRKKRPLKVAELTELLMRW